MKRTPLRRGKPLRRRSTMKRGKRMRQVAALQRRRPEGYDDQEYLAWLRGRPCRAPFQAIHPSGDPHHARHDERGASLGAHVKDDRRAMSMCRGHHDDIHARTGPFKGWTKADVRAWENQQIVQQRAAYRRLPAATTASRPESRPAPLGS